LDYLTKGLEALKEVCIQFLYKNDSLSSEESEEDVEDSSTASTTTTAKCDNHFGKLFAQDLGESPKCNKESVILARNRELDLEILNFAELLGKERIIKLRLSTTDFWKKHKVKMPKLFELQIILLNISASSAFKERFFSISGIVNDVKRANHADEYLVYRSMLKSNMSILTSMNEVA
jgi:hypothetical protein